MVLQSSLLGSGWSLFPSIDFVVSCTTPKTILHTQHKNRKAQVLAFALRENLQLWSWSLILAQLMKSVGVCLTWKLDHIHHGWNFSFQPLMRKPVNVHSCPAYNIITSRDLHHKHTTLMSFPWRRLEVLKVSVGSLQHCNPAYSQPKWFATSHWFGTTEKDILSSHGWRWLWRVCLCSHCLLDIPDKCDTWVPWHMKQHIHIKSVPFPQPRPWGLAVQQGWLSWCPAHSFNYENKI